MEAERKAVEDDLYRRVVEQTTDYAVFVLDPTGHVITWNLGAERIKGYTPEEIIGKHFSAFYTRESIENGRSFTQEWDRCHVDS